MRTELQNINGIRKRFIATFIRFGIKSGYKGVAIKTLLFSNVRDKNGKVYTDHIWFTTGKQFELLDLKNGDNICFDARVTSYVKGYKGRREDYDLPPVKIDYKLSHPNNIVKHTEGQQGELF